MISYSAECILYTITNCNLQLHRQTAVKESSLVQLMLSAFVSSGICKALYHRQASPTTSHLVTSFPLLQLVGLIHVDGTCL